MNKKLSLIGSLMARFGYVKADALPPEWYLRNAAAESVSMNFPNYAEFNEQAELYTKLSWWRIAIHFIATIGAGADFSVKVREGTKLQDVPNHDFDLLLQNPNPYQGQSEFLYDLISYYLINARSYVWLNKRDLNAPPSEMWVIPSNRIAPIPDGKMGIRAYRYDSGDGLIDLAPEEIVEFKGFHPFNQFMGLSDAETFATVATGDLGMQSWNTALFTRSNARLPGILAFADLIPDTDWDTIKRDVDAKSQSRSMLMLRNVRAGGVQWLQASANQRDMEFLAGRRFNRDEIWSLVAPGLSSILSENATEANARAGRATLIDYRVYPLLCSIGDKFTSSVMWTYGERFVLVPDDIRVTDRVLFLQEIAAYERTHTLDEVRAKWGSLPFADEEIGKALAVVAPQMMQSANASIPAGGIQPQQQWNPAPDALDPTANQKMPNGEMNILRDMQAQTRQTQGFDAQKAILALRKWESAAKSRLKDDLPLTFKFTHEDLPEFIHAEVMSGLKAARSNTAIKEVFTLAHSRIKDESGQKSKVEGQSAADVLEGIRLGLEALKHGQTEKVA